MIAKLAQRGLVLADSIRMLGMSGAVRAHAGNLRGKRVGSAPLLGSVVVKGVKHPVQYRMGSSDWPVLQKIFMADDYDIPSPAHARAVDDAYAAMVARGVRPVIIDCGANIGLASIWFANRFPDALIYAIEPEPDNFAILTRNCAGYDHIVPLQLAISDRETHVTLANPSGEPWAWETVEAVGGGIPTTTIERLLARQDGTEPLIVKVDIEGFEVELFRSNTGWVDHTPVIVFESHDSMFPWRGTAHAMLSVLVAQPREYLQRGENIFAILRLSDERGQRP